MGGATHEKRKAIQKRKKAVNDAPVRQQPVGKVYENLCTSNFRTINMIPKWLQNRPQTMKQSKKLGGGVASLGSLSNEEAVGKVCEKTLGFSSI